jgi:hypothetical protein
MGAARANVIDWIGELNEENYVGTEQTAFLEDIEPGSTGNGLCRCKRAGTTR